MLEYIINKLTLLDNKQKQLEQACKSYGNLSVICTNLAGLRVLALSGIPLKFKPESTNLHMMIQEVLLDAGFKWSTGDDTRPPRDYLFARADMTLKEDSEGVSGSFESHKSVLVIVEEQDV